MTPAGSTGKPRRRFVSSGSGSGSSLGSVWLLCPFESRQLVSKRSNHILNLLAARSFYDTVLGPDAGTPGGALAGMPMALLTETWAATFGDDSAPGSCPAS